MTFWDKGSKRRPLIETPWRKYLVCYGGKRGSDDPRKINFPSNVYGFQ